MKNSYVKGLIMAIVAFIASYIGDNIEAGIQWSYVLISTLGIVLAYLGKNAWFKSDSPQWWLNYKDVISGLLLAIGTMISSSVASLIVEGAVDWSALWKAVLAVVIGYFAKTFTSKSK